MIDAVEDKVDDFYKLSKISEERESDASLCYSPEEEKFTSPVSTNHMILGQSPINRWEECHIYNYNSLCKEVDELSRKILKLEMNLGVKEMENWEKIEKLNLNAK